MGVRSAGMEHGGSMEQNSPRIHPISRSADVGGSSGQHGIHVQPKLDHDYISPSHTNGTVTCSLTLAICSCSNGNSLAHSMIMSRSCR